jgi:hypothetical protein
MNYPKKLLALRGLQGGQFGAIDVTAVSDTLIELDFGPDFDRLSPSAARSLVGALTRWHDQPPAAHPESRHVAALRSRHEDRSDRWITLGVPRRI